MKTVSMNEIKRRSKGYFFTADTMRFFSSRLAENGVVLEDGTMLFCTSEHPPGAGRVHSVRIQSVDGRVQPATHEIARQKYATAGTANDAMLSLATEMEGQGE